MRRLQRKKGLDRERCDRKAAAMHCIAANQFSRCPRPAIDGTEIHLWFFPQWHQNSHSAESAAVRGVLATYLDRPADRVTIDRDEHGKPRICDSTWQFNLSHAGGALILAVTDGQPLGIDLESGRKLRSPVELAQRWFAPAEAKALAELPADRLTDTFLRLWTCKEAVLKASGRGIANGLGQVHFAIAPDGRLRGMVQPETGEPAADWHLLALQPSDSHMGALAWRGPSRAVKAFLAD
jgi:4'-phosphopantetheinyl transferase